MKKVELLAPAGNMETLLAAIKGGCDAVYLGGKAFGARAFAKNFDDEELKKAVKLCHLYGVKIYVTANILVYENEIEEFLNYLKFLYEIGVDAVIMQDLGMISLVHKLIPELEIHASTQINCHNKESFKFLEKIGVSRVVLAREMTLDEIKNLGESMEIEVFVHGALCVSYSGNCLFSSLNGGRSGNRGMCAGSCRLPYDLLKDGEIVKEDGKYLLSTKDLCLASNLKEVLDSGVSSLKIEGRMKSPEYVGYVTHVYRRLIDEYYKNGNPQIKRNEIINLKKLFNRTFTSGYMFDESIYNIKSPNHLGSHLGEVIKFDKRRIYIRLDDDLCQEDGIRFTLENKGMIVNKLYDEKCLLKNMVKKGNVAVVDNKVNLKKKSSVNKTIDTLLLKEIDDIKMPKIKIDMKVLALEGRPLRVSVSDEIHEVTKEGPMLEMALKQKMSKDEVREKLCAMGNYPFIIDNFEIEMDDVFIPVKFLKDIKRQCADELINKRCEVHNKVTFDYKKQSVEEDDKNRVSVLVRTEEQLKWILDKNVRIYTEDFDLYKKYKDYDIYYKLPRIMHKFPEFRDEKLLVSEIGSLYKYAHDNKVIGDYPLNVVNSETALFLEKMGCEMVTLSPEVPNINEVQKYVRNTETIVYGRCDLMILKDFYDKDKGLSLRNNMGDSFPIINGDYTTILHHENIERMAQGNIRILLYDEDKKEILRLIEKYKKNFN